MDFTLYKDLNGFADRHDVVEDVLHFFAVDDQYVCVLNRLLRKERRPTSRAS